MNWRQRLAHWWIVRFRGLEKCPKCRQRVKARFAKDWILHPEEPPLFGHYYCPACGHQSGVMESSVATDAARSLGYPDAMTLLKETCKRHGSSDAS